MPRYDEYHYAADIRDNLNQLGAAPVISRREWLDLADVYWRGEAPALHAAIAIKTRRERLAKGAKAVREAVSC